MGSCYHQEPIKWAPAITKKILNYILYIKSKHKESFVKQFF